jgi:hypothetical protein
MKVSRQLYLAPTGLFRHKAVWLLTRLSQHDRNQINVIIDQREVGHMVSMPVNTQCLLDYVLMRASDVIRKGSNFVRKALRVILPAHRGMITRFVGGAA